jgi:cytochrome c-type biogenesis protein CcmH/NrfF
MTRRLLTLVLALTAIVAALPGAAHAQASLPDIEDEVMCPTCKMPLNMSQSPQADEQRAFIRELIAEGRDKEQIKAALVSEYGENVLAEPSDDGFGIVAYAAPVLLIAALAAGLAALLPRRRRRRRAPVPATGAATAGDVDLSPEDSARLDADLARYET